MGEALQIPLTDRERSERHDQFKREMEPFIREMTRIYNIAPHPGFLIKEDGTFEQLPLAKPYQSLIDHLIKMRDEYIASRFPEYQQQKQ